MLIAEWVGIITQPGYRSVAECELLPTCPFFNDKMANMPISKEYIKKNYCRQNNMMCARYMVYKAHGREKVPPTLYPSEINKAIRLISSRKD